jgi:hypothetical protein
VRQLRGYPQLQVIFSFLKGFSFSRGVGTSGKQKKGLYGAGSVRKPKVKV